MEKKERRFYTKKFKREAVNLVAEQGYSPSGPDGLRAPYT